MTEKRIDPNTKIEYIVADWRTGAFTVRQLASKHNVSHGFVGKHTKDVKQDTRTTVDKIVQAKQELALLDGHAVDSVNKIVDERTANIQFFTTAAIRNVKESLQHPCDNQNDFRARADTILKGKEAALGKDVAPSVQITNNVVTTPVTDHLTSMIDRLNAIN
jgi:hypothetical protein